MTKCAFVLVIAIALFAGVTPGWSRQIYLYAPKPVAAEEKFQKKDGVLVQEIPVKKGDTLTAISRKFSGHGSYFPQILLFNDIKDPDKIYTGAVLRIPVSRSAPAGPAAPPRAQQSRMGVPSAGPLADIPAGDQKMGPAAGEKKRDRKHNAAATARKHAKGARQSAATVAATSEQRLFERAIKAYRRDDCRTALELFDRFLVEHPASALAADASLYKAECYLKQSKQ